MSGYSESVKIDSFPRILLEGSLDLTYRCNNNCRHCWLRVPDTPMEERRELALNNVQRIVEEARLLGCRVWGISGGEPMLRADFADIFRYITGRSAAYTLNTNGTLITPKIARLMRKKGMKMVALYGATEDVHDAVTRTPGSYEAVMRGMAYLREAGAGFVVQIVPMKDNYRQMKKMIRLAEALSPVYRIGAPWLYPRADGDSEKNREIFRERLDPADIADLEERNYGMAAGVSPCERPAKGRGLFADCIEKKREFHVDPYGQASFCSFVKDPLLRYDLKKGSLRRFWEEFVPGLAEKVKGGKDYAKNCGRCGLRKDCEWCPVYGRLEHGRYDARVGYLCSVAGEHRKRREGWEASRVRYYGIGGMTVKVESDLPVTEHTFKPAIRAFEVKAPGEDVISIRHRFSLPEWGPRSRGEEVYRKPPWVIYRKGDSWLYLGCSSSGQKEWIHQAAVFNADHSMGDVYSREEAHFLRGGLQALTLFPSDQILLARVLADREGCYLHASGIVLDGKGLLFVGHSDAGKSTISKMLQGRGQVLCDDRIIVRRRHDGFKIYGTWSHGELPDVSAADAPLKAVLFLKKARENRLEYAGQLHDRLRILLACLIKPLVTADWWEKTLSLVERVAREVPCYHLYFDRSGKVVPLLEQMSWRKRNISKK